MFIGWRHWFCSSSWVQLFDVMAEGCHTPLTPDQIAGLYCAGTLGRNDPCKRSESRTWRTIDELFPLLKYGTAFSLHPGSGLAGTAVSRDFLLTAGVLVGVALVLAIYFARDEPTLASERPRTAHVFHSQPVDVANVRSDPASITSPAASIRSPNGSSTQPVPFQPDQGAPSSEFNRDAARLNAESQARAVAQARLEEQGQRELASKEQAQKLAAAREQEDRAAGTNIIIPLDQYTTIGNVGGSSVRVKIHDNNTTSFDVWLDGSVRRDVPKAKGITGSRTDETLIYQSRNARLYYVWEISGELNHCLLRVRDE